MKALKYLVAIYFNLIGTSSFAQGKYDANWCFGIGAGIDFNQVTNPTIFKTFANNAEANASISNSKGQLLFYAVYSDPNSTGGPFRVFNSQGNVIINGDNLNSDETCTNGVAIIPFPGDSAKFYIFHIGRFQTSGCQYAVCYNLYYSIVNKRIDGLLEVADKNVPLLQEPISERLAMVKHANGVDWWLLVTEMDDGHAAPCSNKYYKFLITSDSIKGPYIQQTGGIYCNVYSSSGELTFSESGNFLALSKRGGGISLFNINRCNGLLYNYKLVESSTGAEFYSCEFSPNDRFLYVSEGTRAGNLLQFDITAADIQASKKIIWLNTDYELSIGQLQIAPNGKIYVSSLYTGTSLIRKQSHSQNLSVIQNPNMPGSLANLDTVSFYLGDSSFSYFGLPNMPNYNLGPTSVYLADAGKDTVYCSNLSNGTTIGVPPVANIIYSWTPSRGLSDTTIAQPIASPTKDIWYYLTITDTTNTTSCQSRTDSVFVKVENCTGIYPPSKEQYSYKLIPNFFNGSQVANITLGFKETGFVEIYSITGIVMKRIEVEGGNNNLDMSDLPAGIFIYKVIVNNEEKRKDKLVVL